MATVGVDVRIDDFTDEEIVTELLLRFKDGLPENTLARLKLGVSDLRWIVYFLIQMKCPRDVITQLEEWINQPIPTWEKLRQWNDAVAPK